jgi:hypothetical protein
MDFDRNRALECLKILGFDTKRSDLHILTIEEIKSAYREKAFAHHPDRGGDNKMMNIINVAWKDIKQEHPRLKNLLNPSNDISGFWIRNSQHQSQHSLIEFAVVSAIVALGATYHWYRNHEKSRQTEAKRQLGDRVFADISPPNLS